MFYGVLTRVLQSVLWCFNFGSVAPADLDLLCHSLCELVSATLVKQSDWLAIRRGHGILIYST